MAAAAADLFGDYDFPGMYCEMFGRSGSRPPGHTKAVRDRLAQMGLRQLRVRSQDASDELFNLGITFTVYTEKDTVDRILPFDVIPRLLSPEDWRKISEGVAQRVTAINLYLHDVYHRQKIIKDGVVPADLVLGNPCYRPEMAGVDPPRGTYVHISGTDIVRDEKGRLLVLEDNGRTPSGVSYVIENRHLMMRAFSDLAGGVGIAGVDDYGSRLVRALTEVAPGRMDSPTIVLLSPGSYNSAYFEHVFLAREMGIPLVEGRDLLVHKDRVYMRTTRGEEPVHVIYRRLNDDFLDPEVFRKDSLLGVPGLFRAYSKGNVTLANAIGTGVADDKAVYAYVPRIIRYYLGEDPILDNVETHLCREPAGLRRTLDRLGELVVKPVGESGGYGVVVGPTASRRELARVRDQVRAHPERHIAQPMVNLSVCPTFVRRAVRPCHVDLRPFAVTGRSTWVLPGGLTRVALRRGSMIVNSSQSGGSKDTWVLR